MWGIAHNSQMKVSDTKRHIGPCDPPGLDLETDAPTPCQTYTGNNLSKHEAAH